MACLSEHTDWFERAACMGAPVELFFPEDGDSGTAGKAICGGCAVREACLDYATENGIAHGTWGGRTARERTRRRWRRQGPDGAEPIAS